MATIGSGGDYATIALWEADAPATLTAIWLGELLPGTNLTVTSAATLAGSTSSSSNYKHLTAQSGASFVDNANVRTNALRFNTANGASIACSTYGVETIRVEEAFARITRLQVNNTNAGQARAAVRVTGSGTSVRVDQCILEGNNSGSGRSPYAADTSGTVIARSLIVNRQSATSYIATIQQGGAGAGARNCTFAVPSDLTAATTGVRFSYGPGTMQNCALFGCTQDTASDGGGAGTFTTNYTSDASPSTGFTNATYANVFENTTNAASDFRLRSGSPLIDVGTADSTWFPADISGFTVTGSTDVGCWEFDAGGGGGPTQPPRSMHQYRMRRAA